MLLPDIGFDKVSNFALIFALSDFFAFTSVAFSAKFPSAGVIHGTEKTERIGFDGICLSAEFGIEDVIKVKFS